MIDRVRESRNPKKVIRVSLMESYGEIGRVPVNLLKIESTYVDEEHGPFLVTWDSEGARFCLVGDGLTVDFDNFYGSKCEVIGNVFDNPRLVEY